MNDRSVAVQTTSHPDGIPCYGSHGRGSGEAPTPRRAGRSAAGDIENRDIDTAVTSYGGRDGQEMGIPSPLLCNNPEYRIVTTIPPWKLLAPPSAMRLLTKSDLGSAVHNNLPSVTRTLPFTNPETGTGLRNPRHTGMTVPAATSEYGSWLHPLLRIPLSLLVHELSSCSMSLFMSSIPGSFRSRVTSTLMFYGFLRPVKVFLFHHSQSTLLMSGQGLCW